MNFQGLCKKMIMIANDTFPPEGFQVYFQNELHSGLI